MDNFYSPYCEQLRRKEERQDKPDTSHLEPNGLLFPKGRKCLSRVNCFSFFGIYDEKLVRCIEGSCWKKDQKLYFFFIASLFCVLFMCRQKCDNMPINHVCIFSLLNLFFRYFCLFYRPYCTQTISLDRYLSSFAWFLTVSGFLVLKSGCVTISFTLKFDLTVPTYYLHILFVLFHSIRKFLMIILFFL